MASALPLLPELPHPASAVMPAAAASAAAVILLVVLTDFLLAGQEETRPRPVPAAFCVGDVRQRTVGGAQQHE
ncbi:hypothetical protein GCM10010341_05680 [Streptomyces noursei]|nr:hypothetical protein GCM10010341_05680 [Streptomyces noursei]